MIDALWAWLAGTLPPEEDAAFEARLFDDEELARAAAHACDLRDALRAMSAEGPLTPVVTAEQLGVIAGSARVTEHAPRDGAIRTHIADQDYVAAHIPLATIPERLDVTFCTPTGDPYFTVNEAPFDPASGEVIILCQAHVAMAMGRLVIKVRDERGALLAEVPIENSAP